MEINIKDTMTEIEKDFEVWWSREVVPRDEDMPCDEYAMMLAKIAWMNGSYKIIEYILSKSEESR